MSRGKGGQSPGQGRAGARGRRCPGAPAGPTGLFLWPKLSDPGINQPAQEDRLRGV